MTRRNKLLKAEKEEQEDQEQNPLPEPLPRKQRPSRLQQTEPLRPPHTTLGPFQDHQDFPRETPSKAKNPRKLKENPYNKQ